MIYFETINHNGRMQISDTYPLLKVKEIMDLGDFYDYGDKNLYGYQLFELEDLFAIYNPSETGIYLEAGNLAVTRQEKPIVWLEYGYAPIVATYGNKTISDNLKVITFTTGDEYPPADCGIEIYSADGKRIFSSSNNRIAKPELITYVNCRKAKGFTGGNFGKPTYEYTGELPRTCNISRDYPLAYTRFSKAGLLYSEIGEGGSYMCYLTKSSCRVDTFANFGVIPPDPYWYNRIEYSGCFRNYWQYGLNDSFAVFNISGLV